MNSEGLNEVSFEYPVVLVCSQILNLNTGRTRLKFTLLQLQLIVFEGCYSYNKLFLKINAYVVHCV